MADTNIAPGAHPVDNAAADAFIAKWQGITASELSTFQSFLIDLCNLLGVAAPAGNEFGGSPGGATTR